jgi:enamine deaminase RidA (YjgF/YER057c/UK114 family)
MADAAEEKLKSLGIELPPIPAPAANYVPSVRTGSLLFISGQVSISPAGKFTGKLGADVDIETGQKAARVCAISLLANMKGALGSLDKVARVVKLTGFVNSTLEFTDAHKVMNGCSDLITEVLGERGKHARSAVSVASLPVNAAVEVEAIVEIG